MNLDTTLKSVIETATGYSCYALEKPLEAAIPCSVYRYIGDSPVISHSGDTGSRKDRIQITSVADTYAKLKSLVLNTETALFGTTVNWEVSLPIEIKLESKEDTLYYSIRDYYIRYSI